MDKDKENSLSERTGEKLLASLYISIFNPTWLNWLKFGRTRKVDDIGHAINDQLSSLMFLTVTNSLVFR